MNEHLEIRRKTLLNIFDSAAQAPISVYLLLNSPSEEDYYSRKQTCLDMAQGKAYLDNLANAIRAYALDQQIKRQTAELRIANTEQLGLIADGNKLDGKKADC